MKILTIADHECSVLWECLDKSLLEDVDLIISCGDLDADYLSFLVTFAHCPLLYVPGNHDDRYEHKAPEGCINIDGKVYLHEGIRIVGMGGSMRYKDGNNQYTERQMKKKFNRMVPRIIINGGVDILVTHAPASGVNDGEDLPHQGFEVFGRIIERFKPKYFIHGHVHMNYGRKHPRRDQVGDTTVINAYERYFLEY